MLTTATQNGASEALKAKAADAENGHGAVLIQTAPGRAMTRGGARSRPARLARSTSLWVFAAAALLAGAGTALAQTYLIDFGGANTTIRGAAPDDPNNDWNNITTGIGNTDNGVLSNLVTTAGIPSAINLAMISRFNGVNENGTQNATVYPSEATRDSWFGNTGDHGGLTDIYPKFKLTGLDPATVYTLTFYASRAGVSDNRETGYTVTGGNAGFAALDAANNVDETAVVADITPDGAGEIKIEIGPTENNNNSVKYTYLGVLRIDAVPPQTPLTFTTQPASQRVVQFKPATFTAAVTGSPPHFVQWYQNDQPLEGENRFTLTIPSVTLDMDGWLYSVKVSNLAYEITSTNAVLTVYSDAVPPTATEAVSYDGTTIVVTFDEPMDDTTYDPSNYKVNGGAAELWAATLNPDGQSVTLSLAAPITGTFTLVLNNVQDLAGNPIASGTTLVGHVVPIDDQDLLFDFGATGTTNGFGPAPNDPVRHWNNVTTTVGSSDTGQLLDVVTVHNVLTPITVAMISRFTGANENGTLASTQFPPQATRDSLYGNTELWSGLENIFPSFKLTGLNPARKYNLTFYASRTSVSDNRETGFTVTGANGGFVALDGANNVNTTATVVMIAPTESGEITISLAPIANNNNTYHFTYLGVFHVWPYAEPSQFLPVTVENGKIKLEWTGAGQLHWAPSVFGPWNPVQPAPTSPYIEDIVAGESRFYRLAE